MNIIRYPERESWQQLLKRPELNYSTLEENVKRIIEEVAGKGDRALRDYTKEFDRVSLHSLEVPETEIQAAKDKVSDALKHAIAKARGNIEAFHKKQVHHWETIETTTGVRCWQKPVPISKVGLYIPGGSAPLLSTVLMLGIPAQIAGCPDVILCTPPDGEGKVNPSILYIAELLGIARVFRVGGAQAIAAMAHGTASIPAVNKMLVTDSDDMIHRVRDELSEQLTGLPRRGIADKSMNNSKMILLKDQKEIVDMINMYAPEHLILVTENYGELSEQIINAGSVFLGDFTPESAGDYASGTNHTLPTNGWAHSYSGVNMDSFYKKITFQEISKKGLFNIGDAIMTMAEAEQLQAHSNAVAIRLKSNDDG